MLNEYKKINKCFFKNQVPRGIEFSIERNFITNIMIKSRVIN